MNTSTPLTWVLLMTLLACEQDADTGAGDGGLSQCTHTPVHVLGGPFRPVRRDGFDPPEWEPGVEPTFLFEGEAVFEGLADGVAVWAETSGAQPGRIRVPDGLLQPGTLYGIRHDFVPGPEPDQRLVTSISHDGRLILFSMHGPLEQATEALEGVGLTPVWIPVCRSSAGRTCFAPNTHMALQLTTEAGEIGQIPLGEITTWISDIGTFEVFLEAATDGTGDENICYDLPRSEVWLTLRAVP